MAVKLKYVPENNTMSSKSVKHPVRSTQKPMPPQEKAEIERLQKSIGQKLKDPQMAKKAAQLIEEIIKISQK